MHPRDLLSWFKDQLTILKWLPGYNRADFRADLMSGFTVGVMTIPQVMAYAIIAGLSPVYGLYGALIPLLIFPLFTTSRHLAFGLVATDMIIIAAGASLIAAPGTEKYTYAVLLLTAFVGLVHLALSLARMGFIVNLLSKPVLYGFTAAAPIIISFSQLGNLSGVEVEQSQYVFVILGDFINRIGQIDPVTLALGLFGIGFILLVKKYKPLFPKSLVLLALGAAVVAGFNLQERGIEVVGDIPSGFPGFGIHEFTFEDVRRLIPTIITLVMIQLMSVVSLGKTFANKYRYPFSPNREFFALGAANLVGSLFQSPPVSASFTRTAISEESGARTALSNVVCAVLVGLTLLFLTPLFYYIPIPLLASIIIVSVLSLINIRELFYFFKTKRDDAYIAVFTFASVLLIGIQEGILFGIGASLFMLLYRSSQPNIAVLGHVEGTLFFRDLERHPAAHQINDILILRPDTSFSFQNAEYFKDFIIHKSEEKGKKIRAVILEARSINDLDTTAIEALRSAAETLEDWKIELHFAGLKGTVRDVMLRSGLARKLGGAHFHMTTHHAVIYLLNKWDRAARQEEEETNGEPQRLDDYLRSVD